jgi:hypothetical protein
LETIELCALRGYGVNVNGKNIRCSNVLHGHHILNKSKYRGNKAVAKYVKKHSEVFIAQVCSTHNVERWADTPAAQRILLRKKSKLLGVDYVKQIWDGAPFKVHHPELSYDSIVAAPLPT